VRPAAPGGGGRAGSLSSAYGGWPKRRRFGPRPLLLGTSGRRCAATVTERIKPVGASHEACGSPVHVTWPAPQVGGALSCALELALGEDDGGASSFTNPGRTVFSLSHSALALRYIEENVDAEERALEASFGAGGCPPPPSLHLPRESVGGSRLGCAPRMTPHQPTHTPRKRGGGSRRWRPTHNPRSFRRRRGVAGAHSARSHPLRPVPSFSKTRHSVNSGSIECKSRKRLRRSRRTDAHAGGGSGAPRAGGGEQRRGAAPRGRDGGPLTARRARRRAALAGRGRRVARGRE
jgi:hypothetical protein